MIGTCSIPTGQISTQAMHCMHDHTVSGLMRVAEQVRVRREQRLDAQRGADTEGSLGLLSQIEDEVARRERVARCGGRASLVALAALRAGVELEQMRRREIGDDAVPDLLRCRAGRQLNEALSCHVVPRRDAGRAAQHVHRLRERDRSDEGEGGDAVHPPGAEVRVRSGRARRSRLPAAPWPVSQPTGAHFSNDGSVSAIRSASSRKPVTPEEAGASRRTPSLRPRSASARTARDTVHAAVVEPCRSAAALRGHDQQADDAAPAPKTSRKSE